MDLKTAALCRLVFFLCTNDSDGEPEPEPARRGAGNWLTCVEGVTTGTASLSIWRDHIVSHHTDKRQKSHYPGRWMIHTDFGQTGHWLFWTFYYFFGLIHLPFWAHFSILFALWILYLFAVNLFCGYLQLRLLFVNWWWIWVITVFF